MKIKIIVAIGNSLEIGKDNRLLWRLPNDMKFFKEITKNQIIVTGRKNYESILEKYRPLTDRINIILTTQSNYKAPGALIASNLSDAINKASFYQGKDIFIIGGGKVYREVIFKKLVDELYITKVEGYFDADVFFPEINYSDWDLLSEKQYKKDDRHAYNYTFCKYKKIKPINPDN